jgi:hypothetical protein
VLEVVRALVEVFASLGLEEKRERFAPGPLTRASFVEIRDIVEAHRDRPVRVMKLENLARQLPVRREPEIREDILSAGCGGRLRERTAPDRGRGDGPGLQKIGP